MSEPIFPITHNHSPDSGLIHLRDIERQIGELREKLVVGSPKDNILRQMSIHVRQQCLELTVKRDAMNRLIDEVNGVLMKQGDGDANT